LNPNEVKASFSFFPQYSSKEFSASFAGAIIDKLFRSKKISKFLKKVDCSIYIQILKKLKELEINAYLGKPLKSNYKNFRSLHINKFRVIYNIEKNI
jgi:addiction module RelE/StbE family toxin